MSCALSLAAVPAQAAGTRASRTSCSVRAFGTRPALIERRPAAPTHCRRSVAAAAAAPPAPSAADSEVEELKMALLDSFWGTERGLSASSDSRAEINELLTQLEARNPTPEPNDARAVLGGTWRLAYTSNSELIALLALSRLPLVSVGEITQEIDPLGQTVENRVELTAPLSKTSLSATASFEVRSPKLLQVSFEEGRVATPQLLADLQLPSSLDLLGQRVDLAPVQAALQPVEGQLRSALGALSGLLSQVPDLRIPVRSVQASSWLLNTYLDDTLRITRGDGGSVFVMVRDAGAGAGAMVARDWEALEERDPPPASSSGGADVAGASVAAPQQPAPAVVVEQVEPSAIIEDGEPSSNGGGASYN